jgi:hypothetical protein
MNENKSGVLFLTACVFLILLFIALLVGCDGYRLVAWSFDQNTLSKPEPTVSVADPNMLFQQMSDFLDEYSKSRSLNCSIRPVGPDTRFCGGRSITLELKKHDDGKVAFRIAQFGPLSATKDYTEIRNELLKLMAQRFPQVHVTEIFGIQ